MKHIINYINENKVKFTDIIVLCCGELLLLRRANYIRKFGGKWCFPGGHIDNNETSKDAIIRELKEETGISINDPIFFETYTYSNNDASDVYFIKLIDKPVIKMSREHAQFKWVDINDIDNYKEKFAGESYLILKKFLDNKSYGFNGL